MAPEDFPEARSPLAPDQAKYVHSCYPKNLRRWMGATLPRKKKCRAEFALLAACWAAGWETPFSPDRRSAACRRAVTALCADLLGEPRAEPADLPALAALLWEAGQAAYRRDCRDRR